MTHPFALCLSGWAQSHDALRTILPDALHLPYAQAGSLEAALRILAPHADAPVAVGWSLGGTILLHAAARGIIRPRRLVLLVSPAQFVADGQFPYGMGVQTFSLFADSFRRDPVKTARNFMHLIADGDTRYTQVMEAQRRETPVAYDPWTPWLDVLAALKHDAPDWDRVPPTTLVYGGRDRIVAAQQGEYLHRVLPRSVLHVWEGCAHAPHLHDAAALREILHAHQGKHV